ncbi:hypothetical protein HAX54_040653 [Datura stramonium]|uniref:Uncharacterized protein n=1 Tax=Datura stramonium TaxID=4076 RepID=A0ABS8VN21_DATST|nr:hypothetical protein [Datura stramonium]
MSGLSDGGLGEVVGIVSEPAGTMEKVDQPSSSVPMEEFDDENALIAQTSFTRSKCKGCEAVLQATLRSSKQIRLSKAGATKLVVDIIVIPDNDIEIERRRKRKGKGCGYSKGNNLQFPRNKFSNLVNSKSSLSKLVRKFDNEEKEEALFSSESLGTYDNEDDINNYVDDQEDPHLSRVIQFKFQTMLRG